MAPGGYATRMHGICNASHNRMEEGAHLGQLPSSPTALGLGISASPCFRVLFGKVQQCSILLDQTTGDLKSHHLQDGVTALSVPPPPFLSAVHGKKIRALIASLGGGGTCPSAPPHLGTALARAESIFTLYGNIFSSFVCDSVTDLLQFHETVL